MLEVWLRCLLWEATLPTPFIRTDLDSRGSTFEIHRTKGLLRVANASSRVIQGVREVFEIKETEHTSVLDDSSPFAGKIIFIGRGLAKDTFQRSLDYSLKI